MRMSARSPAMLASLVMSGSALVSPARAQDIQYTSVTTVKFAGPLGTIMNFAAKLGGASGETVETTYIKGAKLRGDADRTTTIVDLDGARFISIDHAQKTYTIMTAKQMAQAIENVQTQVKQAQSQAKAQAQPAQKPEGKAEFTFDMKVDRTGEKQKVNGYNAERAFVTIKTDMTFTPEGQTEKQDAGTLVALNDVWSSKDVPVQKAMERFAKEAPEAARQAGAKDFSAVFAQNPKLGAALEKAAEESAKLEGTAVKETFYLILLPPGMEFDRQLALVSGAGKEKAEGGGLKGLARGALGGMLGARKQEEQKKDEEVKPQQMTLATVLTELRDIQLKSLPASLFEPPAGYREVPFTMPTK